MTFSIVTPSFRASEWLRLCIASVADQEGVALEHLVQDACSDDGTQEWLPRDPRVKASIEKDQGMYDGVNRGFRRATGEILAHLNADEQYLPGALKAVQQEFEARPGVDILLADSVLVDAQGQFICCRKSMVPWRITMWTYSPTMTASLFIRRRALEEYNLYYDVRWRALADGIWMRQAVQMGLKMAVLRRYTSTFTDSGENLSFKPIAQKEARLIKLLRPRWAAAMRWPLLQLHRCRALSSGLYSESPFSYSLYTRSSPNARTSIFVPKPTGIYWKRH